jgi:hypothetical protein
MPSFERRRAFRACRRSYREAQTTPGEHNLLDGDRDEVAEADWLADRPLLALRLLARRCARLDEVPPRVVV